ncbi:MULTISPECIES: TonB-dependent receptor [unclassified Pseudoalteromonas]|uniref:TonB-dependent receptor n=1 Tax=unclassified Pseudoalteromonas TaxID=194690 RepID=UPI0016031A96|nr:MULTISPECIES: TonB-dependent receptor [unclassified Pseudoalteromonas]MBB1334572.1 TonB-dependent receptor [Pseudoalteromonas sp. SR41-6]MBB1435569.1 TonB-dependent receptor [Pseudoalteromonas sp. SG43-6]MBB1460118.1 TonB-dependent receptor [Pseudoalteromonas sp. SG41-8]
MTNNKNSRESADLARRFKKSALLLALMANCHGVYAQEEQKAPENDLEVIEVRGIRASAAENLAIKRLSNATVDAITAEDIGKFPDKNVADSLQRVPGVIIQRDGGEGASVSIRGLSSDLTFTQLNGNFIASSPGEPSRSFSYALLPATMIQRVEVYKSSEARLDEGGIGGTVLLYSRKPLDMDKNSGIINFETSNSDITDKYEPQFSGIYSWKNDDEDFGVLVGYTKQDRTNRSQSSRINIMNKNYLYSEMKDNQMVEDGAQGYAAQSMVQEVLNEERNRTGIQFTTQWRPTSNLELGFNYFNFKLGQDSILNQLEYPEWNNNDNFWTDVRVDEESQFVTGIDYSVGASGTQAVSPIPRINGEYTIEESSSDTYDFYAKYEGDNYNVKLVLGHTEAEGGPSQKYRAAYYANESSLYYGYDFSDGRMTTYMDPSMISNLAAGIGGEPDVTATDSSFVTGTQEEDYGQIDFDYFVDYGVIETLHFGAKYRKGKIHRDTRNSFYLSPDFDIAKGEAEGTIDLDDDYSKNGGIPDIADLIYSDSLGNLSDVINTNLFPAVNWHKYQDYLNENFVHYTRIEPNYVYSVEEEITAAYVQADYRFSQVRGNLGVRVVRTKTTTGSSDKITYRLDWKDDNGNELPIDQQRVEDFVFIEKESTETKVLPSFNIAWDIDDNWVLRGAASQTMARPGYDDLGQFQTLTYTSNEYSTDRSSADNFDAIIDGEGWTGSGGNNQLAPFESTQFDMSLEYYYGAGSGFGIALFKKDVDNFVVPLIIDVTRSAPDISFNLPNAGDEQVNVSGDNFAVRDFSTVANGTNASSEGAEFFIQHFFDNGFGLYANYTRNNTNQANVELDGEKVGESPLIGSSKYQMNLSVFYEDDLFSVRASYNKRGPTVQGYNASWEMNYYNEAYDQVDVNASYNLTDALVLSASVINLTQSDTYMHLGDDTKNRFIQNAYSGRRFYAGATYRF